MKFVALALPGAYLIEAQRIPDPRGFSARTFCEEEFATQGFRQPFVECSVSFNDKAGTLRGMYYQEEQRQRAKLIRCTRGAIFAVIIDLRKNSPTYTQWSGMNLTADNLRMLYVVPGFAHGFQAQENNSEVLYQLTGRDHPDSERGVRWNDPAFGIRWPLNEPIISNRDAAYPDFVL